MQASRHQFRVGTFLVVFLLVVSCTAWADECTGNGVTDFCLDQPNESAADQFPVGTLVMHATLHGNVLNLHVGSVSDPIISGIRIFDVCFNNAEGQGDLFAGIQPSGTTTTWNPRSSGGPSQCDGFGYFTSGTRAPGGNHSTDLTWELAGLPSFDGPPQFVVHLGFDLLCEGEECSGATCTPGGPCSIWLTNIPIPVSNQLPLADAGPDQTVILGESVTFNGTGSSDSDGTINSFDWDFGDGGTANGAIIGHVYATAGSFTATLTVTDDEGATATDTAAITVQTTSQAIGSLSSLVASFNLQQGIANALDAKLQNVMEALDAANAGQRQDAGNKLIAFINAIEAQRGKAITDAQADVLKAQAIRILARL